MTPAAIRRLLLAAVMILGLVGSGTGCSSHSSDDPSIVVTVHDSHPNAIYIEAIDGAGFAHDLGVVQPNEIVHFFMDPAWTGQPLHARCTCDGGLLGVEYAHDGLYWDVF